jgi:hypothetical protein
VLDSVAALELVTHETNRKSNCDYLTLYSLIIWSYIVAAMMPGFGLWIRNVSFGGAGILQNNLVLSLPLLMLAALLFNAGLGVKTEELTRLLSPLLTPFVLHVAGFVTTWRLFGGFARTRIRRGFCLLCWGCICLPEKFSSRE